MRTPWSCPVAIALMTLGLVACADEPDNGSGGSETPVTDPVFGEDPGVDEGETPPGETPPGQDPGDIEDPTGGEGTGEGTTDPGQGNNGQAPVEGPSIWVDPTEHTFSYISPLSQPMSRQFNIGNVGDAPLNITGLTFAAGSSADFALVLIPPLPKVIQPGKTTMLHVSFQEVEGGGTATLQVESTDPDHPVTEIELDSHAKATTTPPGSCAALVPSQLKFGDVERGTTKKLQTTLTNCGDAATLTLNDITRSQQLFFLLTEEFQIDNMPALPASLASGASLPLTVSYTPKLAGPDAGYFIFHTDDPEEPQSNLDVSGNGVAPPPEELGLTIKLSWDADECDVDSHLIAPGGTLFDCDTDCFYSNPTPDWGIEGDWLDDPFLDIDDVDGFGPEHINISEPINGTYRYVVHYYSDSYDSGFGGGASASTNATVELQSFGQTVATFGPEFLDTTNRTWDVFEVEWPSMNVTTLGNTWMITNGQMNTCMDWPW